MEKVDKILKTLEELAEGKTAQEIHEMIQEAIEKTGRDTPDIDKRGITEFYCLVERYLVNKVKMKEAFN